MDWGKFENYLRMKSLSDETVSLYQLYFNKLDLALTSYGLDETALNQDMVNAFITDTPHIVNRAFLKNYLKHINRYDLQIPDATGRKEKKQIVLIPKEHIRMLRDTLYEDDIKWGLVFDVTYYGALRRSEVLGIRLCDLNLSELRTDPNAPRKILITGKGKRQRYILLPRLVFKALVLYAREKGLKMEDKIFKVAKKTWWLHFFKAQVKLGFITVNKDTKLKALYHPHSIRHSRSSEWWEEGKDIVQIQRRLGHSDISTTRIYINPDEKKEEKIWSEEYN